MAFDRWEQCVSFSTKEVNIYAMDHPCDEDTYNAILGTSPFTVVENVYPSFDDMINWDVGSISSEFVLWMSDDHAQPGSTSLVNILSSSAFESMISKFVGRCLSKHLRLLIELTSFRYSHGSKASYADYDSTSLWSLRSFAGTRVLQELELALGNASLNAASLEKLTTLFLVLFATIIAAGYSNPRCPSGDMGASTFRLPVYQSPTSSEPCASGPSAQVFSEARKHLRRILAHHMVYIAERINLLETQVSRKRIIEGSACQWNRRATFQCQEMPAPKNADVQTVLVSPCDTQDDSRRADRTLPTRHPARSYHLSRSHPANSSCRLTGPFGTCVHEQSLNIEPSPMDRILAGYQQMTLSPRDVQVQIERASTQRVDPESIRHAPHSTRRCSQDHMPSISTRDRNYAAFECLAETDGMCAPFLCTDGNDNAHEASSMIGTPALTTSPSTLQSSEQSFSTTSGSPPSIRSQASMSTCDTNSDQGSVCRSCMFATLPFDALDQDELCQFCAAFPQHSADIAASSSNDLPDQRVPAQGQLSWLDDDYGSVNLLV